MAGRVVPVISRRLHEDLSTPEGLRVLAEGDSSVTVTTILPWRSDEVSDTEDFMDVAQQLQMAETREKLKAIVEGNRGPNRSRRSSRDARARDTVASLRSAMSSRREQKFASLTSVSEGSSEAPFGELSQQMFMTAAVQSDLCSSAGAPASGEDNLSAFLEEGSETAAAVPQEATALTVYTEVYATKEELATVMACFRRVERKVDWLMAQERKMKLVESSNSLASSLVYHPLTPVEAFYALVWLPAKTTLRCAIWPLRAVVPALDWVESMAMCIFK